jgi:hypothetical protein
VGGADRVGFADYRCTGVLAARCPALGAGNGVTARRSERCCQRVVTTLLDESVRLRASIEALDEHRRHSVDRIHCDGRSAERTGAEQRWNAIQGSRRARGAAIVQQSLCGNSGARQQFRLKRQAATGAYPGGCATGRHRQVVDCCERSAVSEPNLTTAPQRRTSCNVSACRAASPAGYNGNRAAATAHHSSYGTERVGCP